MADHTLPDADPADELEQHQSADDPEEPVRSPSDRPIADPVPEADALEQNQPVPDPECNDPQSIDPG